MSNRALPWNYFPTCTSGVPTSKVDGVRLFCRWYHEDGRDAFIFCTVRWEEAKNDYVDADICILIRQTGKDDVILWHGSIANAESDLLEQGFFG